MTLRIPRTLLIVLGVVLLAGAGVAAYFLLIDSDDEEAEAQRRADECRAQVGHLLNDAQELNSRLDVGITWPEYNTQVGNISVAYGEVNQDELDSECGSDVAVHLEDAMNKYSRASTVWNNCLTDFGCGIGSIKLELQTIWFEASADIAVAQHGLEHMADPGATEEEELPFGET